MRKRIQSTLQAPTDRASLLAWNVAFGSFSLLSLLTKRNIFYCARIVHRNRDIRREDTRKHSGALNPLRKFIKSSSLRPPSLHFPRRILSNNGYLISQRRGFHPTYLLPITILEVRPMHSLLQPRRQTRERAFQQAWELGRRIKTRTKNLSFVTTAGYEHAYRGSRAA